MDDEGMATLLDFKQVGVFQHGDGLELDRSDLQRAAEGCPVNIIHVD